MWGERCQKILAKLVGNRLRTIENQLDAGKVQVRQALAFEQLEKVFVAEIRGTELRCTKLIDLTHPQQRPTDKYAGVHHSVIHARGHDAHVISNQPHVVGQWHPAQALVILHPVRCLDNCANIGAQVAVRQAHTLGITRGTRRILDECNVVGCCREQLAVITGLDVANQRRSGLENIRDLVQILIAREAEQPRQQIGFCE